jgi:hypothetical protein
MVIYDYFLIKVFCKMKLFRLVVNRCSITTNDDGQIEFCDYVYILEKLEKGDINNETCPIRRQ